MRIALIQTEIDGSRPMAERVAGVAEQIAGRAGDDLVLLPELWATGYFAFDDYAATAEPLDGPLVRTLGEAARAAGVTLHGGSMVERDEAGRLHNTSLLFDPDGTLVHTYRKVHLFGYGSREQELLTPGERVGAHGPVALSTCYDLRFPELFRILAIKGATVITLPAAFTKITGQAHWEILIRARAIENQVFMVAAGQVGMHPENKESYGNSMIVDPWGEVLARVTEDGPGFCAADLDFHRQAEVRDKLPSLANRQARAYVWPQEAGVR
jgi:predicted amidohydrolase